MKFAAATTRIPGWHRLAVALLATFSIHVHAHPIPDIPVRAYFDGGPACTLEIEIDPRCFEEDPNAAAYLMKAQLEQLTDSEKTELLTAAAEYAKEMVDIEFLPGGDLEPVWDFDFGGLAKANPKNADDPIVIQGVWKTAVPKGSTGYRIRSSSECELAVNFENEIQGKPVERISVLFPGETSYTLDLSGIAQSGN
jgi:hypothetical protein